VRQGSRPGIDGLAPLRLGDSYNTQYEGGVCDRNTFCTGATPAQNLASAVPEAIRKFGKKIYVVAADYNYRQIVFIKGSLIYYRALETLKGFPKRWLLQQPQKLFNEASNFGIRFGFTVPIHDGHGPVAALTFASREAGRCRSCRWP
jgi:substrate-binding family protein/autoinducer binding domain-containing protein